MRSPTFNVSEDIARQFDDTLSLLLFERMCRVRYFETGVVDAVARKEITYLVYLSYGQEAVAAALSTEIGSYLLFPQHRAHDVYLSFGGDPGGLRDELMGRPTGTSQGRAGSNCLQYHRNGMAMFGHHGLIGENVPQAVGAALGSGHPTACFFGDGAAEEDYVLAAMGFAATHKLPVLFVCLDNDLSILTPIAERRSWNISDIARAFGMPAEDTADDPWAVIHHTRRLTRQLPALLNCYVCRGYWHAGIGIDGPPEWDRFQRVWSVLGDRGLASRAAAVEAQVRVEMETLWDRKLSLEPLKK